MKRVTSPCFPRLIRVFLLFMAVGAGARGALWVAPGGDDRNPGTEEQPLLSLARARDVVRTLNRDMSDDITVFIAGEHHVDQPLAFQPEDSGSNGFSIIYTAAPGERPVISGAYRVTGWTLSDRARNLWSAPAPAGLQDTHDLFVNGTAAGRTRGRMLQFFQRDSEVSSPAVAGSKAQWKNPTDVIFSPTAQGAIWSERAGTAPVWVENAFELLGTPGEWYFDRPARRVYYRPRPGEDMATADAEAAVASGLIAVTGARDRPVTGLIFKGIRFEYTTWTHSPDPTAPGSPLVPPPALAFYFARDIQLQEDAFVHMATRALALGPGLEGGTVNGCLFGDISGSALAMTGASGIRVSDSRFSYVAAEHGEDGAIAVDHCADVTIETSRIDHFPNAAIVTSGENPGALRETANLISEPMIGWHGAPPSSPPAAGGGITAAYQALEREQFAVPTIPRPPLNVSAEPEDEFAYVTWIPSCVDGGLPVTAYAVTSSTGANTMISADDFRSKGYVIFGGLDDGHSVTFTVSATNSTGSSPPSLPTAGIVPLHKRKLRVPSAPALVSVSTGKGGTSIQITPSAVDGGSPIIAYSVALPTTAAPIVIEGLDVIHSDVAHPLSRRIGDMQLQRGASVSITSSNVAGESKPTVVKILP